MLSNSSFNALLKTLEEPPPHVKFLLATTDPQKLPMTILSRCLQFNLKNMNPERIVNHLKYVLGQEVIPFEETALWQLGRAADGSMRDALSLTDQAISYGSGKISEAEVAAMLGTLDQAAVYEIVTALASLDGKAILAAVHKMSEQAPDYSNALAELLSMLHRIAIAQALPEAVDNSHGDKEQIMQLAQQLPSEDIQLFYQTALLGRRDLPLAPDPRAGFEMVLLRMLAFKPQGVIDVPTQALPQTSARPAPTTAAPLPTPAVSQPPVAPEPILDAKPVGESPSADTVAAPLVAKVPAAALPFEGPYDNYEQESDNVAEDYDEYAPAPAYLDAGIGAEGISAVEATSSPTYEESQQALHEEDSSLKKYEAAEPQIISETTINEIVINHAPVEAVAASIIVDASVARQKIPYEQASPNDWPAIYVGLGVSGILQSTIANCQWVERQGNEFYFIVDENNSTLYDPGHQQRLADLLSDYFVETIQVKIQPGKVSVETPAMIAQRHKKERQANAVVAIKTDPIVLQLIQQFDATLREDTIEPV